MLSRMLGWVMDARQDDGMGQGRRQRGFPEPSCHLPHSKIQVLHALPWDLSSSSGFQASCSGASSGLMAWFPLTTPSALQEPTERLKTQPRPSQSQSH